ncbi:MAG: hypothetical protein HY895_13980 [Deltaproteobacteria bacterium]|nr:hypothetical protein [Deltaproteobacteria bacterium]
MSGQPQAAPWISFNVTGLTVTEPPPTLAPSTIIPRTGSFVMSAQYAIDFVFGKGLNDLIVGGLPVFEYNVTYFAESIGPGAEWSGTPPAISCILGNYTYGAPQTSLTVSAMSLTPGTYRTTCVAKMSPRGGGSGGFPFHVVGFVEGPMIEIYQP